MQKHALYAAWLGRLRHLETARHAFLGVQLGIVAYALNNLLITEATSSTAPRFGPHWHILYFLGGILVFLVSRVILDQYQKGNLIAIELMLLEYQEGLVSRGLGYFSFREGRPRRAYHLHPVLGVLVLFVYAAVSPLLLMTNGIEASGHQYLFFVYPFLILCLVARDSRRAKKLLSFKDTLECWAAKQIRARGEIKDFSSLVRQKRSRFCSQSSIPSDLFGNRKSHRSRNLSQQGDQLAKSNLESGDNKHTPAALQQTVKSILRTFAGKQSTYVLHAATSLESDLDLSSYERRVLAEPLEAAARVYNPDARIRKSEAQRLKTCIEALELTSKRAGFDGSWVGDN